MNLDGGIHEIPLPSSGGRLWLCGKHVIAPDPENVLARMSADHVVCLVQPHELMDRYPQYVEWLQASGRATWFPIADLSFPSHEAIQELFGGIVRRLHRGEAIITHCAAGIGRAGTLAVSVCIEMGMPMNEALDHVRRHRPGAGPEVGMQMDLVRSIDESRVRSLMNVQDAPE